MSFKKSPFDQQGIKIVDKELAFDGFQQLYKIQLQHRLFEGQWSPVLERELFVKRVCAAAVVYDPVHDLIGMVEQFRAGLLESEYGAWSLEGVAGMVEHGEQPEELIRRELIEEAGLHEVQLRKITACYTMPGSCNELTHIFCALCDLSDAGGLFGLADEGEDIRFEVYSAQKVFDAMLESRASNGATLIALQWLQYHREQLRTAGS